MKQTITRQDGLECFKKYANIKPKLNFQSAVFRAAVSDRNRQQASLLAVAFEHQRSKISKDVILHLLCCSSEPTPWT